ncbi:ABC transporter substrate-binding protein [Roseococcus suduntuyensis]|uniref:ABC-type glycerol-3-phosphate transport system substrate-binding protein n=1 Tax=Roseococcus suduntuyensis TaxID=455361 RepID=A0A840A534_9PROT|nr:extracellular solute-binding protein [Roseococcus suduntuyensis]MBB3897078.1 ABC-type glycerol-3-phosphate transport system substrate-binding protein [Roseococcus suduntuyensis]
MADKDLSRRALLGAGATAFAAGTLSAPAVFAQPTTTLRCGFWDHWVPAGNGAIRELCAEWGQQNRVNVQVDFITSVGNQNLLTIAAQAQSRSGHDLLSFPTWEPAAKADLLEPVDDVMGRLIGKYGPVNDAAEYLGKIRGTWRAIPAVSGTQMKPACVRFDLLEQHAGIDIRAMWPAENRRGPGADSWNWDTFLAAAEKCHAAGVPFGMPMGSFTDAVDTVGAILASFGASMMDARGNVTVRGNAKLKTAVEYLVRLSRFLPNDVWAWDDGANNRALISGRSALIFNPPSAWAVAKRDAPQVAEKCWTVPMPAGPEGRFVPYLPYFWGIWAFSRNKGPAKQLLEFLSERSSAEKQTNTSNGYDIPPFSSMSDFAVWANEGPPVGTVYNYPLREHHNARASVAQAPAPAEFAVQAYQQALNTKVVARVNQGGETVDQALAWLERELNTIRRGG